MPEMDKIVSDGKLRLSKTSKTHYAVWACYYYLNCLYCNTSCIEKRYFNHYITCRSFGNC